MGKTPHAKKSLGQHFLMHRAIAGRIADAARLSKTDTVLEIGPGTGMLTHELLLRAGNVVAVEADGELVKGLREKFERDIQEDRLTLLNKDVRNFSPETLPQGYALVANIPYYLTGALFEQFLSAQNHPSRIVFLVQKEVAIRAAREKKESLFSLSLKAYGMPRYLFTVPRGAFRPPPKVDSAVLNIEGISRKNFHNEIGEKHFFRVLKAGFAHKRKLLAGNLKDFGGTELVQAAFAEVDISQTARAEDIALDKWVRLAWALKKPTLLR